MSIDPSTLADGTVIELNFGSGDRAIVIRSRDGYVHNLRNIESGVPFSFAGKTIVRTFSPDPLPSQEVPRDQWATIRPCSRVRIVETNGDEHTVTVVEVRCAHDYIPTATYTYGGAETARVFLLDEPADPDADLIERMAKAFHEQDFATPWESLHESTREGIRTQTRAALAVVREQEATS